MSETFGKEHGEVVGHISCVRCSSPAVIRAKLTSDEDIYIHTLTCNKCHLVKFVGLASAAFVDDEKLLLKLKNKKATTRIQRDRIDAKIADLEKKLVFSGLLNLTLERR